MDKTASLNTSFLILIKMVVEYINYLGILGLILIALGWIPQIIEIRRPSTKI